MVGVFGLSILSFGVKMATGLELVPVTSQKHDPAWKHCQMYKNGDRVQLKCVYCGKMFKGGGIHRIKEHLAGQKGNAASCLRVQPEVRVLMQESLSVTVVKKGKKQKVTEEITSFSAIEGDGLVNECGLNGEVELVPYAEDVVEPSLFVNREEGVGNKSGIRKKRERNRKFAVRTPVVAAPLSSHMALTSRRVNNHVCEAIGRFLFDIGVPLDAVNSKYFQPMIEAISSQGTEIEGPTYHDLRSWILKSSIQEVRGDIKQCTGSWGKTGCSVLVDEWTSEKGKTLISFFVYSPERVSFLRSVDVTDILESVDALHELLKEVLQEVGVRNVVQVVTNCEERYVVVGQRLSNTFPTVFWTPCAAQCVNLMLDDFRELEWITTILEQSKSISRFIYNHTVLLNMMRRYTDGVDLVDVGETRSSTDFATLKRMVNIRHNLHSMVTSEEWMECSYSKRPEGYAMLDYISNQSFWSMCTLITRLTVPLLRLLRIVGGKERPGMGYIYAGLYRAKETIKKELVTKKDYIVYWNIIDQRWEQLQRHPLHAAGFYLNPKFLYSTEGDIHQIRSLVYDCIEKSVPDPKIQDKIVKETSSYNDAVGDLGRKMAVRARDTLLPAEWWSMYGGACPNLSRLAIRVLSQTCSLIGCLPNRIAAEQIHETKNLIERQRLSDLVFVQCNLRLRQIFPNNVEQAPVDPISYEKISLVEEWVTEKEVCSEETGRSDWMKVDPPLGSFQVDDDFEALGAGFDDQEILEGVKGNEDEIGEDNLPSP